MPLTKSPVTGDPNACCRVQGNAITDSTWMPRPKRLPKNVQVSANSSVAAAAIADPVTTALMTHRGRSRNSSPSTIGQPLTAVPAAASTPASTGRRAASSRAPAAAATGSRSRRAQLIRPSSGTRTTQAQAPAGCPPSRLHAAASRSSTPRSSNSISSTKPAPNGPGRTSTRSRTGAVRGGYIHVTPSGMAAVVPIWSAQNPYSARSPHARGRPGKSFEA